MFNVVRFLERHQISHVTKGANVAKGCVNIKCPFCGDQDPSEHLGWSITKGRWGCFRNARHGGKNPHRLIMRLIGCSYETAQSIVEGNDQSLDHFTETIRRLRNSQEQTVESEQELRMPAEFRPITSKSIGRYYVQYLIGRGFKRSDIETLTDNYGLRFCHSGPWSRRIIFPLRYEGKLVCWTGRTINKRKTLRYLTLTPTGEVGNICALRTTKELVYNYDELLKGGSVLVVTEGPLDALKVDVYAREFDVRATCLFGVGVTPTQVDLMHEVARNFDRLVILGDEGTRFSNSWLLKSKLARHQPIIFKLPDGVDDPGALKPTQVRNLARRM